MNEDAVTLVWLAQAILPPLIAAGIIGYLKSVVGSIRKDIDVVAKDVRKSSERIEESVSEIKLSMASHESRVQELERNQAYRLGREEALQQH